jgi:hypothetical protein
MPLQMTQPRHFPDAGHVSPQFHCQFDDLCDTLKPSTGNPTVPSLWQEKTGFKEATQAKQVTFEKAHAKSSVTAEVQQQVIQERIEQLEERDDQGYSSDRESDQRLEEIQEEPDAPIVDDETTQDTILKPTRSGRVPKPTSRWRASREQQEQRLVSLYVPWEVFHNNEFELQEELDDLIAFAASSNPDIMYLDEAMRVPDKKEF